jgi:CubicO group peptidase (beta-lactamase class C family)
MGGCCKRFDLERPQRRKAQAWTFTLIAALATYVPAHADEELQAFMNKALPWVRLRDHQPAVAALIQIDGQLAAEGADGLRAVDRPEPVTIDDRWHIGSDTKAITATMIARLVERHVMSFDDTLVDAFPAFAKSMHPEYRKITVKQLLSHTAGLPQMNTDEEQTAYVEAVRSAGTLQAQRTAMARRALSLPPSFKPGVFKYSNLGYIIVGAIAEARTGKSWERLIREEVFVPLGIRNAGFGAPGSAGAYDEPHGHREANGTLLPVDPGEPESDNPAVMGPCGTINIALKDWALFAQDQLDGPVGHGKLLRASTYRLLQTPVTDGVALGWLVERGPDGSPERLTHSGSNTLWYARIMLFPKRHVLVLIATNSGSTAAEKMVHDLLFGLADHLKLVD